MKLDLKKELPLLAIVLAPMVYLAIVWNDMSNRVPMHWNLEGEVDRWGDKTELAILSIAMPIGIYLLLLFIPRIDPKKKIENMGGKWHQVRFVMAIFISGLTMFIIYSCKNVAMADSNVIFAIIGLIMALLGNFFPTMKPNYFIGIRTPWTLENDAIWKSTHQLAGRIWVICGLLIAIIGMASENKTVVIPVMIGLVAIMVVVPIVHSYVAYKKLPKQTSDPRNG